MIKKLLKYLKNDLKNNYKTYIVFILILSTFFIKLDYNIYSPGGLINLNDRIETNNKYTEEGSFNLTYVTARSGIIPNILLSYIIPSWDLVPTSDVKVDDESMKEVNLRNRIYLEETSYNAIIAAYKEAGKPYTVNSTDLKVTYIIDKDNNNLEVGDTIKEINGVKIDSYETLKQEKDKYKEKDKLNIKVLRNNKEKECYAILKKDKNNNLTIGIYLATLKNVSTLEEVKYVFKNNESGSSRGLMCALEIYNRIIDYDITKGDIIAGTGSIDENGIVGDIDGVKYKLKGAVKNKTKVFIVPSGNYDEALKLKEENNYDIELIKADNLHNVIENLKNR